MKKSNIVKASTLLTLAMILLSANVSVRASGSDLCGIDSRLLEYDMGSDSYSMTMNSSLEMSPMLADISALRYAPVISMAPVQISGTADIYVQRLAERGRSQRIKTGVVGLIFGGLFIGSGVFISGDEELSEDFGSSASTALYIAGAAMAGVGIYSLAVPSRAEREYDNLMMIEDPVAREAAGHEALISLANDAKTARMIGGAAYLGFGVYFLAARPFGIEESTYSYYGTSTDYGYMNDIMAGTYGLMGLLSFVLKSEEEKSLERYQMEIADGSGLDLHFGPQKGGVGATLVYNF